MKTYAVEPLKHNHIACHNFLNKQIRAELTVPILYNIIELYSELTVTKLIIIHDQAAL